MRAHIKSLLTVTIFLLCSAWAGLIAAADAIEGEQYCDRPVESIVFAGNRITKPQILLREIDLQVDQACDIDLIIESTQSIMDLGLYSYAIADLSLVEQKLQLQFTVKEKINYLLIPRISRTSDAEVRVGVQFRVENVLGRLHQLRVTSEYRKENDGSGPDGFVHRMNYNIPRFLGSDYGLTVELSSDRRKKNFAQNGVEYGFGESETKMIGLVATRWLNRSKGVQGLRYFFGARYKFRTLVLNNGAFGPFSGGVDSTLVVGIEDKRVHQDIYRRRGSLLGGSISVGNSHTGSDFNYAKADLYAAAYVPLKRGIRNINLQARLGISNGAAFGEKSFQMDGGELMRGLKGGNTDGDIMALVNVEYLHAWFDRPQWRWVAFADVGNVYDKSEVNLLKLRARGGVGLRWKLLSLSNTDLRIDVAWDPNRSKMQSYVSSNLTF